MSTAIVGRKSVKLGTVIRNVVNITYKELDELITNMSAQTGTLRTQKLRQFCHRAMKRLLQLYALCKWIMTPDVVVFLNDISTLQQHMQEIENELNKMQDTLYFTHANLYSKRFNPLEVRASQDLFARGKITSLPQQMLVYAPEDEDKITEWYKHLYVSSASASASASSSRYTEADTDADADADADAVVVDSDNSMTNNHAHVKDKLVKQLNNAIKVKAIYSEGVDLYGTKTHNVVIQDGMLVISVPGFFKLSLTLRFVSDDSPWKLLGCEFLVQPHLNEHMEQNVIYLDELNVNLLQSLSNACECDRAVNSSGQSKPTAGLNELLSMCQYASTAAILRYIFVQALNYTRLVGLRHMEVNYYELTNAQTHVTTSDARDLYNSSVCRFKFWKDDAVEGSYRYVIAIMQIRNIHSVLVQYRSSDQQRIPNSALKPELSLVIELQEQLAEISSNGLRLEQGKPRVVPVEMFAPGQRTMYNIFSDGVSFQIYKDKVLELCAGTKLMYIYCYITFLFHSHCDALVANPDLVSVGFDPTMVELLLFPTPELPSEVHILFRCAGGAGGQADMDTHRVVLAVDRQDGSFVLYTNSYYRHMTATQQGIATKVCDILRYELNSNRNLLVKGRSGTSCIHRNCRDYLFWLKAEGSTEFGDLSDENTATIVRSSSENTVANGDAFIRLTEFAYFVAPHPPTTSAVAVATVAAATAANVDPTDDDILSKYSNVKNSILWCILTLHECVNVTTVK